MLSARKLLLAYIAIAVLLPLLDAFKLTLPIKAERKAPPPKRQNVLDPNFVVEQSNLFDSYDTLYYCTISIGTPPQVWSPRL
jgi:hypothetical protein